MASSAPIKAKSTASCIGHVRMKIMCNNKKLDPDTPVEINVTMTPL